MLDGMNLAGEQGIRNQRSFSSPTIGGIDVTPSFVPCPQEIVNFFIASPWKDEDLCNRVTYEILLSLPPENTEVYVTKGGLWLVIESTLPKLLVEVDKRNDAFFQAIAPGKPRYDARHYRTIAQKSATKMLTTKNEKGKIIAFQKIRLPFKCDEEFTKREGRAGIKYKYIKPGNHMAVVELIEYKGNQELVAAEKKGEVHVADYVSAAISAADDASSACDQSVYSVDYRGRRGRRSSNGRNALFSVCEDDDEDGDDEMDVEEDDLPQRVPITQVNVPSPGNVNLQNSAAPYRNVAVVQQPNFQEKVNPIQEPHVEQVPKEVVNSPEPKPSSLQISLDEQLKKARAAEQQKRQAQSDETRKLAVAAARAREAHNDALRHAVHKRRVKSDQSAAAATRTKSSRRGKKTRKRSGNDVHDNRSVQTDSSNDDTVCFGK